MDSAVPFSKDAVSLLPLYASFEAERETSVKIAYSVKTQSKGHSWLIANRLKTFSPVQKHTSVLGSSVLEIPAFPPQVLLIPMLIPVSSAYFFWPMIIFSFISSSQSSGSVNTDSGVSN